MSLKCSMNSFTKQRKGQIQKKILIFFQCNSTNHSKRLTTFVRLLRAVSEDLVRNSSKLRSDTLLKFRYIWTGWTFHDSLKAREGNKNNSGSGRFGEYGEWSIIVLDILRGSCARRSQYAGGRCPGTYTTSQFGTALHRSPLLSSTIFSKSWCLCVAPLYFIPRVTLTPFDWSKWVFAWTW